SVDTLRNRSMRSRLRSPRVCVYLPVKVFGVMAAPNVRLKVLEQMKRVTIVSIDAGVGRIFSDTIAWIESGTIRKNHLVGSSGIEKRRNPRGRSSCMTGCVVWGENYIA